MIDTDELRARVGGLMGDQSAPMTVREMVDLLDEIKHLRYSLHMVVALGGGPAPTEPDPERGSDG